jgi:YVTN family beta-propeller protein
VAAAAGRAAVSAIALAVLAGCGNTYRPVVATIGVVGPASQPTKYAVAISSPSLLSPGQQCPAPGQPTANGLLTLVDFSGDTTLDTTALGVNPFYFVLSSSGNQGFTLNCDHTVNSFAVSTALIESEVSETTLLSGSNPSSLFPSANYTYISDPGVSAIDQLASTPPALKQELPVTAGYTPVYIVGQPGSDRIYAISKGPGAAAGQVTAIEVGDNTISATLPVGHGPVYGVMTVDMRRAFVLNQTDGTVTVINAETDALDQFPANPSIPNVLTSTINLGTGTQPVWADLASGQDELVVANKGAVIGITAYSISSNVVTFTTSAQGLTAGQSVTLSGFPTSTFLNNQVVKVSATGLSATSFQAAFTHANAGATEAGTGSTGSVTLVNIPLCSATAVPTTTNCDANNPIDATSFGQVVATIPVGINPIMVSVLSDFTRAYVANQGVPGLPCAAVPVAGVSTSCTVSVVNLTSNTVTATIPIGGHPAYIATSDATPTGKAYVVCNDSQVMTVIETDTDSLDTTIPLQGYGISVRVTLP